MIRNNKKTFLPKTEMCKKQVLQDPGNVDTVNTCMNTTFQGPMRYHRLPSIQLNYNVHSYTKYSSYMKL